MGRGKETWQNAAKGDNRHTMPGNGHTKTHKRDIRKNKKETQGNTEKGYTKIPKKGIIRGGKREKICGKIKSQDFPKSKICTYQKKAVILSAHSDNRPYMVDTYIGMHTKGGDRPYMVDTYIGKPKRVQRRARERQTIKNNRYESKSIRENECHLGSSYQFLRTEQL